MSNWHKVSEELPPNGVDVLTWEKSQGFAIAVFTDWYWLPSGNIQAYDLDMTDPTHWTELPPEPM